MDEEITKETSAEPDQYDRCIENVIEFLLNEKTATVTFSQGRFKNKIRRLAQEYPDDCRIIAENADGSICVLVPVRWVRIQPPRAGREFSEEEKEVLRERMINARAKRKDNKNEP